MGTKFASYTLKLASLHEYYQRLLHGNQPIPSGVDISNSVKYFLQSLLSLLKDVEKSPYEMLKSQKLDNERMALYPNLDYKQLYNALSQLIDVIPSIHLGVHVLGRTLLQCLACLLPFLDHDLIDSLPYLSASTIAVLPDELHQEIINYLCYYILPFTISRQTNDENENYASQSISAVIMIVFEYSKNPAHHCQLLECLMALKTGVVKDILCVIAYGTTIAKISATKLLFYYWPTFNPNLFDRKSILMKFSNNFTPFVCQRDDCPNAGNAEAAKVCYNHAISIAFATDSPPPLYLCIECANEIHRENPNQLFYDILHPMQQVSLVCENKNCRASDKSAASICFSTECASYNSNHPIRYCRQCHSIRHNNRRGEDHVYHTALDHISQMDAQAQTYMVQAIISLLREVEPIKINMNKDLSETYSTKANTMYAIKYNSSSHLVNNECASMEERQLLGRYGIWLLIGLCTPNNEMPIEILGRLLSMLFHWFHTTAYSFDGIKKSLIHLVFSVGQTESTLEKLKTEYICNWLLEVMKTHYDVFVSCLLPHPSDYVRIGGHWETLASRTSHLKDGLNRLFCLVPYEVITPEIWDHVMPHWMEAISNDVPLQELQELKITLCKILDPDMSPLGFDTKKMYNFVAKRFSNSNMKIQQQALNWLQILTRLGITIPLSQLFSMFNNGIDVHESCFINSNDIATKTNSNQANCIKESIIYRIDENISEKSTPLSDDEIPTSKYFKIASDEELNLSCCILMLDILLKQMELQNIEKHIGIHSWVCRDACHLLKTTSINRWTARHNCNDVIECSFCESTVIWHQLCLQLLTYIVPEKLAHPPDMMYEGSVEESERRSPLEGIKKSENKPDVVMNMPIPELHSVGGVLVHMPHFFEQIMTATVETVSEQLDLATIMPTEKVISAVARAVTLSETDVATATANIGKANILGENNQSTVQSDEDLDNFWQTSIGKFRFSIDDLPEQLQYTHKLFKELDIVKNPDILCYMLKCLNKICLYGDILSAAVKDNQGFFIWCQENLIINNLWKLLNAEHSHIAQMAVPLLLHCITLPCGVDTFWYIIQEQFHSTDWRTRFTAVERVTLIARFMDSTPLKSALSLQTSLANIFCYLINSMDDSNVYVAQKATLYLGTLHDTAIKALLMCMETQFDLVVIDRPIILQSLYQLHNCLCDRRILTWEFFLNRFDTLFIEAQINLEKFEDITHFRDLKNTDINSEMFLKKIQRAHDALSNCDGNENLIKTLSSSFGNKWPYKRCMSIPVSTMSRQDIRQGSDRDRPYNRQYSGPILKRKSSRFGLGQLIGYTLPNNSIADIHIPSLSITEDSNLPNFTNKIMELEEADKETIHLLVFLLMQFLSRPDQAYPSEEKLLSKTQGVVLRHLYLLLGYNQNDKNFYMTPQKLRSSAVFNVFITNLPQVLDQNNNMGIFIIQPFLSILLNSPCPPQKAIQHDNFSPTYSLWHLESYCRRSWLISLLVILYKYDYGQQQWSNMLVILIRIVLHTLDKQYHRCKYIPATLVMTSVPFRSRDISQPSLGVEVEMMSTTFDDVEQDSPLLRTSASNHVIGYNLNQNIDSNLEETKFIKSHLHTYPRLDANKNSAMLLKESPEITKAYSDIDQSVSAAPSTIFQKIMPINDDECYNISAASSHSSYTSCNNNGQHLLTSYNSCISITVPAIERLLPVGSVFRTNAQLHGQNMENYTSSNITSSQSTSELEIPLQERLLPIGSQKDQYPSLNTKVHQIANEVNLTELTSSTSLMQNYFIGDNVCIDNDIKDDISSKIHSSTLESNYNMSQLINPRKLIKQMALESPAIYLESNYSRRYNVEYNSSIKKMDQKENISNQELKTSKYLFQNKEISVKDLLRCSECGLPKEEYTDDELGLCIIVLGTFIHREPYLAAPLLPEILNTVTNISLNITYPWQCEASTFLPGGAVSVAHQFLRCILHQLAPNGIFMQIFQTNIKGISCLRFFKSIVHALVDFNELNPIAPLQILIESLNAKKSLPTERLSTILQNIACYLDCLPLEAGSGSGATIWNGLIIQFDGLFRRLVLMLSIIDDLIPILRIMMSILKVPGIQQFKGMLDPFSKIISYAIQNSIINYTILVKLCYLCQRNFIRDRDKHYFSRTIIFELTQAIKFKTMLPDTNYLLLLQFVLQDVGGLLLSTINLNNNHLNAKRIYNTNASESLRNQISDVIDFLMDIHTSTKIKSYTVGLRSGFNEDTISGILKCGLAQYLALEITKGNSRDNRGITRYLPWLYSTPSATPQGVREYLDYVSHIRLLSWLLLGSLTHTLAAMKNNLIQSHGLPIPIAQPIPQEASCYIVDHIQIIFSSFPEQYRTTAINISSLFHAFNLCQLWTLYLEAYSKNSMINSETQNITINILLDFWSKVTPYILQLILHSKLFADIANLHFLNLLETFLDCGCTILNKLLPIWNLILFSHHIQLPEHLYIRLQHCYNTSIESEDKDNNIKKYRNSSYLFQWLKRLQFKMGQIEMQSSNITQFYSL